jgi:hypothetical protein
MEERIMEDNNDKKTAKLQSLATKTQDEIAEEILALELRNETLQESYDTQRRLNVDFRTTLRDYLSEQFEGNEDSITVTRDEANELLVNCGCDELEAEFTVTLTVEITLSVTAPNEDTAIDMAKDSLSIDNDDSNVTVNDWDVTEESADRDN